MDLQRQKQMQETTTIPASSLATSASQLVHKADKSHQTLGLPQADMP